MRYMYCSFKVEKRGLLKLLCQTLTLWHQIIIVNDQLLLFGINCMYCMYSVLILCEYFRQVVSARIVQQLPLFKYHSYIEIINTFLQLWIVSCVLFCLYFFTFVTLLDVALLSVDYLITFLFCCNNVLILILHGSLSSTICFYVFVGQRQVVLVRILPTQQSLILCANETIVVLCKIAMTLKIQYICFCIVLWNFDQEINFAQRNMLCCEFLVWYCKDFRKSCSHKFQLPLKQCSSQPDRRIHSITHCHYYINSSYWADQTGKFTNIDWN